MPSPPPAIPRQRWEYYLDEDAWERAYRRRNINSDAEAAMQLQVAASTLSRVRGCKIRPSNELMAHVRHFWPAEQFDDLFRLRKKAS